MRDGAAKSEAESHEAVATNVMPRSSDPTSTATLLVAARLAHDTAKCPPANRNHLARHVPAAVETRTFSCKAQAHSVSCALVYGSFTWLNARHGSWAETVACGTWPRGPSRFLTAGPAGSISISASVDSKQGSLLRIECAGSGNPSFRASAVGLMKLS